MTESNDTPSDWKLKLRYGKIKTPYQHFTLIAEGKRDIPSEEYACPAGPAFMGIKTWASSHDEAYDMVRVIGKQLGFTVTGRIMLYYTEPEEPPRDNPYGYGTNFTPFDGEDPTTESNATSC